MPRTVLARRVLPKLTSKHIKADIHPKQRNGPRLYNAKRLIQASQSALWHNNELKEEVKKSLFNKTYDEGIWRKHVSQDVADFIDDMEAQGTKLLPEEQYALLSDPVKFFSRPQNVPAILRKQVYLPKFTITLLKQSPGPQYAQFHVPMWFNKLDLKSYLKSVYNVDVVHVRSHIKFGRLRRIRAKYNRRSRGPMIRQHSLKYMTVQLVKPFTWPIADRDIDRTPYESTKFNKVSKVQTQASRLEQDPLKKLIDHKQRLSVADQARELLEGKQKWQPTWEEFPNTKRMMFGDREASASSANPPPR